MVDDSYRSVTARDNGTMGKLFPVLSITSLVIFLIFLNGFPIIMGYNIIYFTGMFSFGLSYLVYRMNKSLKVEYEIEIDGDCVTANKVTNKKKSETLASFSLRDCEYIGPVTSDKFTGHNGESDFVLNMTKDRKYKLDDDNWYFFVEQGGIRYILIFAFDKEMYPIFRRYNAHRTYTMVYKAG